MGRCPFGVGCVSSSASVSDLTERGAATSPAIDPGAPTTVALTLRFGRRAARFREYRRGRQSVAPGGSRAETQQISRANRDDGRRMLHLGELHGLWMISDVSCL